MKPTRIQRKRTKGWKMPENTVYVGRGSIWGNPFKLGEHWRHGAGRIENSNLALNTQLLKAFGDRKLTQEDCVLAYKLYLEYAGLPYHSGTIPYHDGCYWPEPTRLKGKNLACWCLLTQACHADELLKRANGI